MKRGPLRRPFKVLVDAAQKDLERCQTPDEIEVLFQREISHAYRIDYHWNGAARCADKLIELCNARTLRIAAEDPAGRLLAIRVDKGHGCSRQYRVGGEWYRTPVWGNGTGLRYALKSFEIWYAEKLAHAGVAGDQVERIVSWTIEGFFWRAMRLIKAGTSKSPVSQEARRSKNG